MNTAYWADDMVTIHLGDCREVLATMPEASIDAVCTDPPYEIGFMGRGWDASGIAFNPDVWRECLRVLKPGGHLLAFGAARAYHRMAVAIEDAGWELRDTIMWIYGSGFSKGINVSKAIDKAAGAEREVVGRYQPPSGKPWNLAADESVPGYSGGLGLRSASLNVTAPATEDAARWDGWNTTLKPGHEPIVLARKPLAGTVVATVLEYGTGALNVDACRTSAGQDCRDKCASVVGLGSNRNGAAYGEWTGTREDSASPLGRWPTNLVFTHSALCVEGGPCEPDCPVAELDRQSGVSVSSGGVRGGQIGANATFGRYQHNGPRANAGGLGDRGGASRYYPVFRYEAKAPSSERPKLDDGTAHATVKPLSLMRWLVRLVTPPGGVVLDPFGGTGTTAEAATIEGFRSVLVELEPPHAELIKQRLTKAIQPVLFGEVNQ